MKIIFAAFVLAAAVAFPVFAQDKPKEDSADEQETKLISMEEALKIVSAVRNNEVKLKAYCESQALYLKADEAAEKNDMKTADELSAKAEKAGEAVGEEFDDVLTLAAELDPEKAESKKLFDALEGLDSACQP